MEKEKKMENSNVKNIVSVEVLDKVFPHIAGYDEIRREPIRLSTSLRTLVFIRKEVDIVQKDGSYTAFLEQERAVLSWI